MRSFFVQIFGWFWAAITVMILALFAVNAAWRAAFPDLGPGKHGMLRAGAVAAATVYENYGSNAYENVTESMRGEGGPASFLLDTTGRDVLGREVPERAFEVGLIARERGRTAVRELEDGDIAIATPVQGPSGSRYLSVSIMPDPPPRFRFLVPEYMEWALLAAAILVAGLVVYLLARFLAAPVAKLQDASRRLAAGDLSARAGPGLRWHYNELSDLGRDFDHMAERLETLVRSQQELLRNVSHELRSPLARLNVALGLARLRVGEDVEPSLGRIERETERLNELIGRLLTLSKLETGDTELRTECVDFSEIVERVVDDANFELTQRAASVELEAPESVRVNASPDLLHSAVENVVRNAIRFTPEGRGIEVRLLEVEQDGRRRAILRVRDYGPGIPDEELAEVFRPFHRLEESRQRETGGAGLGLAIARQAVEAHGGSIIAENAAGGGLEVIIVLPVGG